VAEDFSGDAADRDRTPFTSDSRKHVSVWVKP
jgi:hypothetical protein